jgi:triosephosphate isomerase
MHKTVSESVDFVIQLRDALGRCEDREVVVAPPFVALSRVAESLKGSDIAVAAQNVHWEDKGAYTGEVAPAMVKDAGCRYVIIGHSERRQYFGETDETVNKKVRAILPHELCPIMCVGEQLEQREQGETFAVVERQLMGGLEGLPDTDGRRIVIAYEPVWAIGTGKQASPEQAQEVHAFIRELLAHRFNRECADDMRIQYGGSVKPETINDLMSQTDIDGALVGGASLEVESFVALVRFG